MSIIRANTERQSQANGFISSHFVGFFCQGWMTNTVYRHSWLAKMNPQTPNWVEVGVDTIWAENLLILFFYFQCLEYLTKVFLMISNKF